MIQRIVIEFLSCQDENIKIIGNYLTLDERLLAHLCDWDQQEG